jgi:Zn-dependent oligopeptidase
LLPIELSDDRNTRKKATEVKWQFYGENAQAVEDIFDGMVKLRHSMALKLGFRSFTEVDMPECAARIIPLKWLPISADK